MNAPNCTQTISWHTPRSDLAPSWRQWVATGLRKAGRDLLVLVEVAATWSERASERRRLFTLDERMLKDIGAGRADVWREAGKPFWRA